MYRHAPGPRRAGVRCVANCATQCSGDGLAFRDGGEPGGMHGECATDGGRAPLPRVPRRIVRPAAGPSGVRGWMAGFDRGEPVSAARAVEASSARMWLSFIVSRPFSMLDG